MGNTEVKSGELGNIDLYTNQLKYGKYLEKKKKVYRFLFLIASIVSVITMFALPMFRYSVKGNSRKNIASIMGDYTPVYMIQKYFENGLGPRSVLNTCLMISLIVLIILSIYIAVGAVLNVFLKKALDSNKILNKLFHYGKLEIFSTIFLILTFAAMVFCRVDVSGNAENLLGFWIFCASSIVMICTSIPLSSK